MSKKKDLRSRGTPTKPKRILRGMSNVDGTRNKQPSFTELDIGMKDPYKKFRSAYQKRMYEKKYGTIPMTPMEEADYARNFGTDFIQKVGPKGYTRKRLNYGQNMAKEQGSMSGGGKVRGMGAATQGGKFTRNG